VEWSRKTVYIGGRYRKLARDVPQSPWIIEGDKRRASLCPSGAVGSLLPVVSIVWMARPP
jgi:tRNA U54 and U55 pseudouridine synthase Pus10